MANWWLVIEIATFVSGLWVGLFALWMHCRLERQWDATLNLWLMDADDEDEGEDEADRHEWAGQLVDDPARGWNRVQ